MPPINLGPFEDTFDRHRDKHMLRQLTLRPVRIPPPSVVPPLIRPLVVAASDGADLTPVLLRITNELGFDSFMHGVSLSMHPNAESHSFVFTTLPMQWVAMYDQRSYIEIDPRVQFGLESMLPYIWDRESLQGRSPALDDFLTNAAQYGVSSGVSISIRDAHSRGGITALSSAKPLLDASARKCIEDRISDIIALGCYFHELVIMAILELHLPPLSRGSPLSPRERQCLAMAARGLTSLDIAGKLGISERTANFHFTNINTKLNALNRKEAVARAVAQGIIHLES